MMIAALVLRDIHEPLAPSWWPPAPGWWLLAAMILLVLAFVSWRAMKRRARHRSVRVLFDGTIDAATTPAAKVAAMSELLRRASRRKDPGADKLDGDDWLRFLDAGLPEPEFSSGAGVLLRDGAFRKDASEHEVEALRQLARRRFLDWMGAGR